MGLIMRKVSSKGNLTFETVNLILKKIVTDFI